MVEPASHRKLIGNVSLYRHIANRPKFFLRRNLDFVLEQHEKTLTRLTDPKGVTDALAKGEDMVANEKSRSGWDYPTKEMLQDLLVGQKPMLKIDALQIRSHDVDAARKSRSKRRLKPEIQTDFLPNPNIDFSTPVLVTVIFRDSSYSSGSHGRMYVDTKRATIQSKETQKNKHRQFDICLEEPFVIEVGKIYVTVDAGKNNSQRWKRSVPAKYELKVEINFQDPSNSAKLLSMLEDKTQSKVDQISSKESTLRATWPHLPQCPEYGTLLNLSRMNGHNNIEFGHGIEISMGWSRKRDSPLTQYTRIMRKMNEHPRNQLPTPSSSEESEKPPRSYRITYVFQETRHHIVENLRCPLCVTEPQRGTHVYPTFDRLHLHLLTHHDHFRPKVENANEATDGDQSAIRKIVHLELADKSFERTSLSPDEEEQWIAPLTPFDQAAYLRGEDKWTGHPRVKPQGKTAAKRGRPPNHPPVSGVCPTEQRQTTTTARPSAREVKDLPMKPKKRHAVPTVPGIRFYRTLSKRQFREGELVSESDDEVDETWLRERLHDDLASLGFTPAASEFIEDFNEHAGEEGFAADVLTREGVVRFARRFRAKLRRAEWRDEFAKCLHELRRQRIIDEGVLKYCLSLTEPVDVGEGGEPMDLDVAEDLQRTNLPASMKSYSTWQPVKEPSLEEKASNCVCGKPVQSTRGSIICDNLRCTRVQFHLPCVGLERRQEGWLCEGCRPKNPAPEG